MSKLTSVNLTEEDAKYIAEQGLTPTKWIRYSIIRHKKQEKLIQDLQFIAEKLQVEDVSKKRIQRLVRALNQIPAEEKHELINELALNVIGIEKTDRELAETLQKINNSLKAVDKAKKTEN